MAYISLSDLQREQNRLNLNLIRYSLDEEWHSSKVIAELRKRIYPKLPTGLFDPQDLEHQVLFRLTTYDPSKITDNVIDETISEQLSIIEDRLKDVSNREFLFRGFNRHSKDLNIHERLELKHDGDLLYATGFGRTLDVEFKKIKDESIIRLFTEKLHYIHSSRSNGDTFGFFFVGDDIPWGVETVEPSLNVKKYKREALIAHGIDPNKAVEITRLYLLPGSPKNAISILDGLVSQYYKDLGMEAMYTTTMPMYAKTRGATTAGGMRNILLTKEQSHTFIPQKIDNKLVYVHQVALSKQNNTIKTHSNFPTLLTVETFMYLNKNHDLKPLDLLEDKVIFIPSSKRRSDKVSEMRFSVTSIPSLLEQIQKLQFPHTKTLYIKDTFWGYKELKSKLRLRQLYDGNSIKYCVSSKYRISSKNYIRTVVNDIIHQGTDRDNAVSSIKITNQKYKPENSYEKIRIVYELNKCHIYLDICPFGTFVKIVGDNMTVSSVAHSLGFAKEDDIAKHVDDIYIDWSRRMGLKEMWDVQFGLNGEKTNEPE